MLRRPNFQTAIVSNCCPHILELRYAVYLTIFLRLKNMKRHGPYPKKQNIPASLEWLKLRCASRTSQSVTSMRNVLATLSIFQCMTGVQSSPLHLTGVAPILNFWYVSVNNLCLQSEFPRISERKGLRGCLCDSNMTGTLKHGHTAHLTGITGRDADWQAHPDSCVKW
jgi:hypothetical protein